MAKLILKSGDQAGMEYQVKHNLVIGRRLELPVHLNDPKASREHAKIVLESGTYVLVDLNSTNGTFVNDERVSRVVLENGTIFRVGHTRILFHEPAKQAPSAAPSSALVQKKIKLDQPAPKKINVKLKPTKTRRDRLK